MAATIDKTGPWTIKAISTEARNLAIGAARQDGLTAGQWLEKKIMGDWTQIPMEGSAGGLSIEQITARMQAEAALLQARAAVLQGMAAVKTAGLRGWDQKGIVASLRGPQAPLIPSPKRLPAPEAA